MHLIVNRDKKIRNKNMIEYKHQHLVTGEPPPQQKTINTCQAKICGQLLTQAFCKQEM